VTRPLVILIADDHAMVRGMLKRRLDAEPDMTVAAAVSNADEAVTAVLRLNPDILLMDIEMPGSDSFGVARTIRERCPDTRIIFLSAFFHDRYIEQALAVQAWGYVTKSEPEDSVIRAIRKVAAGLAYFSPQIQARIVVDSAGARLTHPRRSRVSTLTHRELEVLRYIARGMAKKEIARTMHISANTVNRHTTNLMTKLDIHDRVELARYAIREGLADA